MRYLEKEQQGYDISIVLFFANTVTIYTSWRLEFHIAEPPRNPDTI